MILHSVLCEAFFDVLVFATEQNVGFRHATRGGEPVKRFCEPPSVVQLRVYVQ